MYCTNCGNSVNGEACNKCGTIVNGSQVQINVPVQQVQQVEQVGRDNGILVIKRKNSFVGIAIDVTLTVDGYEYKLSNNQQLAFTLTPGIHKVTYKTWCRRMKNVDINVVSGGDYLMDFTVDWLWGGFKLSKNSKLQ